MKNNFVKTTLTKPLSDYPNWNFLKDFTTEMIRLDFEVARVQYNLFLHYDEEEKEEPWQGGCNFLGLTTAVEVFFGKGIEQLYPRLWNAIHDVACALAFDVYPDDGKFAELKQIAEKMAAYIFSASVNPCPRAATVELMETFSKQYPHLNIEKSRQRCRDINGGLYL